MSKPLSGSLYKRGSVFWIKYYSNGRPFYESSKSRKRQDAIRLLDQRRAEIASGTHIDNPAVRRVTIGDLLDDLVLNYKINGQDHVWAERVVRKHLRPKFGDSQAVKLKRSAIEEYIRQRQDAGAKNSTINKASALLHRAFVLGRESEKVGTIPNFPKKLKENNTRKGFFEWEPFVAVRAALPEAVKPVITFAYWTGCRKSEILRLRWEQVDLINGLIRLEPGETKNHEARSIPLTSELREVLTMQKAIRDQNWPECQWVFFRQGKRIRDFRKAWDIACKDAGLLSETGRPERLFHDLRRTGVRNMVRAGVPERVAMAISGHKTRSVFDRYNIVCERDIQEAGRKLDQYLGSQRAGCSDILVTNSLPKDNPGKEQLARKCIN